MAVKTSVGKYLLQNFNNTLGADFWLRLEKMILYIVATDRNYISVEYFLNYITDYGNRK